MVTEGSHRRLVAEMTDDLRGIVRYGLRSRRVVRIPRAWSRAVVVGLPPTGKAAAVGRYHRKLHLAPRHALIGADSEGALDGAVVDRRLGSDLCLVGHI